MHFACSCFESHNSSKMEEYGEEITSRASWNLGEVKPNLR